MKSKDCFRFSFLKAIRNHHNYFFLVLSSLCFFIILFIVAIYFNFHSFINDSFIKNPGFRTLSVLLNKEDSVDDIPHVEETYYSNNDLFPVDSSFKTHYLDGSIVLYYGSTKTLPKVVYGGSFDENDRNVAICPIKFYPDSSAGEPDMNKEYILKKDEVLNRTFSFSYSSYKKGVFEDGYPVKDQTFTEEFKIIGLYDNTKILKFNNECFIPAKQLIEITNTENPYFDENTIPSTFILVDDFSNLEMVKNELHKRGYANVEVKNSIDFEYVERIDLCIFILFVLVAFGTGIVSVFLIKKEILREKENLGILKTIGFRKQDIAKMYLIEYLIVFSIAFVIAFGLFLTAFYILKMQFLDFLTSIGIVIQLDLKIIVIGLLFTVIFSSFIGIFTLRKVLKSEIITLLESGE